MRILTYAAFVALGFAASRSTAVEVPATPFDAAELFAVYRVVPDGGPGTREIVNSKESATRETFHVAARPLLTLRDVERIEFPRQRGPEPSLERLSISVDVMKYHHPNTGKPEATSGPALAFHSHLNKDQNLEFTLGGDGRPIAGRIVDPQDPGRNWSKSQIEFALVPPCSYTLAELREKKLGHYAEGYEHFLESNYGRAYASGKTPLSADGSFRIERLPAARYWIYVYPESGKKGRRVKTLCMELIDGGKSDDLLDLGELKVLDHDASPY